MRYKKWLNLNVILIVAMLFLLGCAPKTSDDDDDEVSTTTSSTMTTSSTTTSTQVGKENITGRVSNGSPVSGAALSTQCGTATSSTSSSNTSGADGSLTVEVEKDSYPCVVNATSNSVTMRSISTESDDVVNVNPVTNLIVEEQVTDNLAAPRYDAYGRTISRSLSEVTAALFNQNGNTIVDRVFTGGFSFATDFDKSYTTNEAKSGANLADTLFRSVDESVGGLSDISTIIKRANDTTDNSVSGGFLNDPAFQAVVASEVVAVSNGSETIALDDEIGVLSAGAAIADVRETINTLVKDEGDIKKAARVAGAVLKDVVKNTSNVTDLNQVASNVVSAAGDTIKSVASGQNEAEGKVVGEQIGATLARATDFTNATSVTDSLASLTTIAGNTKTVVETTISTAGTGLSAKKKDKFLEELAAAAMDFVISSDTNFISDPANADPAVADNVAKNTATAFKNLEQVLNVELSNTDALESVLESASKTTKTNVKDIVATDPTATSEVKLPNGSTTIISISDQMSNVGKNVGDFVSTYTETIVGKATEGTSDSSKAASVTGATIAAAFDKAAADSGNDLKGTGTDLEEAAKLAAANKAGGVAAQLATQIDTRNETGDLLDVATAAAADRALKAATTNTVELADESNDGLVQVLTALQTLESKGFDAQSAATALNNSDLGAQQIAETLEVLKSSATAVDTTVTATQANTIIDLSVQAVAQSGTGNANTNAALVVTTLLTGVKNDDFTDATSTVTTEVSNITTETVVNATSITEGVDTTGVDVEQISDGASSSGDTATTTEQTDNVTDVGEVTAPEAITLVPTPNTQLKPEDGKFGVDLGTNLVITFDKAVKFGSGDVVIDDGDGTQTTITVNTNDTDGAVTISSDGLTVTIDPTNNLSAQKSYTVTVAAGALTDTQDTPIPVKEVSWSFETLDNIAPTVDSTSPTANATSVGINTNIVLNFSEIVFATGTGNITVGTQSFASDSSNVAGSGSKKITITLPASLPADTPISVNIPATAFRDASNNELSTAVQFSFTTAVGAVGWGLESNQVTVARSNTPATLTVASNGTATTAEFLSTASDELPTISFVPVATGNISDSNSTLGWEITTGAGDQRSLTAILTGVNATVDDTATPPLNLIVTTDAKLYITGRNANGQIVNAEVDNAQEDLQDRLFSTSGSTLTIKQNELRTIIQNKVGADKAEFLNLGAIGEYTYSFYIQSNAKPGFVTGTSPLTVSDFPVNTALVEAGRSRREATIEAGSAYVIQGQYNIVEANTVSYTIGDIGGISIGGSPASTGSSGTSIVTSGGSLALAVTEIPSGKVFTGWGTSGCTLSTTCTLTPTGDVSIAPSFADLSVTVTPSTISITEGGDAATATISLNGILASAYTPTITVDSTAYDSSNTHVTITPSDFSIATGSQSVEITITAIEDTDSDVHKVVVEGTEISVFDNDKPSVFVSSTSQAVGEDAGTVSLTVSLTQALSVEATVPFTVTGTATDSSDYSNVSSSPLTFPVGATTQTITLDVTNDTDQESDETIIVTLEAPSPSAEVGLGTNNVHTITINADSNDDPMVMFSAASQTVNEGDSVTVTVSLSKASTGAVSVPYTIGSGSTASSSDYSSLAAGTVDITAGNTAGTITFSIVDDSDEESAETIIIDLGTPTGAQSGTPASHTVTIAANDTSANTATFNSVPDIAVGDIGLIVSNTAGGLNTSMTISTKFTCGSDTDSGFNINTVISSATQLNFLISTTAGTGDLCQGSTLTSLAFSEDLPANTVVTIRNGSSDAATFTVPAPPSNVVTFSGTVADIAVGDIGLIIADIAGGLSTSLTLSTKFNCGSDADSGFNVNTVISSATQLNFLISTTAGTGDLCQGSTLGTLTFSDNLPSGTTIRLRNGSSDAATYTVP